MSAFPDGRLTELLRLYFGVRRVQKSAGTHTAPWSYPNAIPATGNSVVRLCSCTAAKAIGDASPAGDQHRQQVINPVMAPPQPQQNWGHSLEHSDQQPSYPSNTLEQLAITQTFMSQCQSGWPADRSCPSPGTSYRRLWPRIRMFFGRGDALLGQPTAERSARARIDTGVVATSPPATDTRLGRGPHHPSGPRLKLR
jgi:hypothetical protein